MSRRARRTLRALRSPRRSVGPAPAGPAPAVDRTVLINERDVSQHVFALRFNADVSPAHHYDGTGDGR